MAQSKGKEFEARFKQQFLASFPNSFILRLPDQVSGYKYTSSNICDFIVYKHPNIFYLECKSCYGNTLNFHAITQHQKEGLRAKAFIPGVIAGVIVWFIDWDKTYFVPIMTIIEMEEEGVKSINRKTIEMERGVIEIKGTKKRVFFNYDMDEFFKEVQND